MLSSIAIEGGRSLFAAAVKVNAPMYSTKPIKIHEYATKTHNIPARCFGKTNNASARAETPTEKSTEPIKTTTVEQAGAKVHDLTELRTDRALFYPEQMEWLDDRLVRISKPSKNVMQSGTAYTNCWKIEFNSEPRYEYWLMGWTSTNDPVSNLTLTFPTKESAIAFCERNKLQWFTEEQPERKIRRKSYADNFSWDKRTRLGNK